jgi:peptide/nickel transport system permease protein
MIGRFFQSREVRKFRRNRLAVAALIIVLLYGGIAGSILLGGLITLEETLDRVGPAAVPGLFSRSSPEKRLLDCEFYLSTVERALKRRNPREALREISLGNLRVVDQPAEAVREIVEHGWALFDELAESANLNDEPEKLPAVDEIEATVASLFKPLSGMEALGQKFRYALGLDRQGRSIAVRATYSVKVAIQVGVVAAAVSVALGTLLGAAAAYFGGWVDHLVIWLYSTFSSIPNLVLLAVLVVMFTGSRFDGTLIPVYAAFCMTFWIGPCRVIRGETLKIKQLEYVQAATAVGFNRFYILLKHVIPNTVHLMFINFSLLFIGAVKSEVILSFLGLGVKKGPSWGIMINHSGQEVINGFFWQIGAATAFMFGLVLAFNLLTDALQDAFDPKHV